MPVIPDSKKALSHSCRRGFTLLEVLISALILSLVMLGLMNVFSGSKRYLLGSRWRVTAGEFGRYFLEPLSLNVSQNSWSASWLGAGGNYISSVTLDGINYNASYNITPNFNLTNVSKVRLNITWNDTTIKALDNLSGIDDCYGDFRVFGLEHRQY